jgi:hypothetical protein
MKHLILLFSFSIIACGGEGEKPSTRTTVTGPKGDTGEQGPAGSDGQDGIDGTSCTVSEVFDDEGESLGGLIECEDGSSVFIKHGETKPKGGKK